MNNQEYQTWVRKMWTGKAKRLSLRDDYIMGIGLGGETGEVLEILKKSVRDEVAPDMKHLTEELGDVLYYLTMICCRHGITLQDILDKNVKKLELRFAKRKKSR
jgi:NTP pyrophosphatase (non-canonical NTP hydrolase)